MMLINVSRELAKPLAKHIKPVKALDSKSLQPDFLWRAEVAQIGVDICVVAQEQYTNYILVLCGLVKDDFEHFTQLFAERIGREAIAICMQAGLYDSPTLSKYIKSLMGEQQYQLDPEPIEEGRLINVVEKLERRFIYDRKPLPTDGKSAFEFGFDINSRRPKTDQREDKPSAAEAFGNLCLNLIEIQIQAEQEKIKANMPAADNIVRIDFSRQRNA